jgi:spermidine synthase
MSSIETSEEDGVRYLHFGSHWVQGAMRIARPWALELEYTREMMLPLILRTGHGDWPRSVLQVGLGAASITKFLHRHRPRATLTVVEIAPAVVATARQAFRLPDDPQRIAIEIGDGCAFMADAGPRHDFIVVDGFDAKGRAGRLDALPFYRDCLARLSREGVLAVNLLDRRKGVAASVARLQEVFGKRVLVLPAGEQGNTVVLAARGSAIRESFDDLRAAALSLKAETGLNLLPTLTRLVEAQSGSGGLLLI